jgi:hypothetical protein
MNLSAIAGGSPFAHLLGRQRAAAGNSKADEREDDEDEKKAARAEDEKDDRADESEDEKKDAKAAESEDDENKDEDDAGKAKGKRAKADGDDDSDEEDEDDAKASAARRRERARCAAIFAEPAAATRPDMAAYFAFGTTMPRSAAINALKAVVAGHSEPAPKSRGGLSDRMAKTPSPNVGTEPTQPTGSASLAQQIVAAGKKARGEA